MKTSILLALHGLLMFQLSACGDEKLKKVEVLKEFRIIGVTTTASEVAPGGSATLRLIVADPLGGGRTLTGQVQMCTDPGVSRGATVSCAHDPSTVNTTYTIDTVNDADLGAANLYTGVATATVTANVPASILTGKSARDQFNGVAYLVLFTFTDNGRSVKAFKRIIATNRASLNANPTFSSINHNGAAITSKPLNNEPMSLTTSGEETYQVQNVDGSTETRTEKFEAAWYVTHGELSNSKARSSETIRYKSDPPGATLVVIVILRDERGGVAVRRATLP